MKKSLGSQSRVRTIIEDQLESVVQRLQGDARRFRKGRSLIRCWNCGASVTKFLKKNRKIPHNREIGVGRRDEAIVDP